MLINRILIHRNFIPCAWDFAHTHESLQGFYNVARHNFWIAPLSPISSCFWPQTYWNVTPGPAANFRCFGGQCQNNLENNQRNKSVNLRKKISKARIRLDVRVAPECPAKSWTKPQSSSGGDAKGGHWKLTTLSFFVKHERTFGCHSRHIQTVVRCNRVENINAPSQMEVFRNEHSVPEDL